MKLKKLLSFFLVLIILATAFSGLTVTTSAYSKSGKWFNLSWSIKNNVLTISGSGDMYDYFEKDEWGDAYTYPWNADSPEEIKTIIIGDKVNSVAKDAFNFTDYYRSACTKIIIGKSVDLIENHAFGMVSDYETRPYIFFKGSESKWKDVEIYGSNSVLTTAKVHFKTTDHKIIKKKLVPATTKKSGYTEEKLCKYCGKVVKAGKKIPRITSIYVSSDMYKGKKITQDVIIYAGSKKLSKKKDFTVSNITKKKVGKYKATIKFKGNYSGKIKKTYYIYPKLNKYYIEGWGKTSKTLKVKSSHKVTFKSSNKKVATVNSKGKITLKKPGSAYINVTSHGVKTSCYVYVEKNSINYIESIDFVGRKLKLTMSGTGHTSWSSSNYSAATVSGGTVKHTGNGTAVIKATRNGVQKKCKITSITPEYAASKLLIVLKDNLYYPNSLTIDSIYYGKDNNDNDTVCIKYEALNGSGYYVTNYISANLTYKKFSGYTNIHYGYGFIACHYPSGMNLYGTRKLSISKVRNLATGKKITVSNGTSSNKYDIYYW